MQGCTHMAQDISAQSTKPNEQGQKNPNWKRNSRITLSPKIIFKICISKLQQQNIGENSLSPPTLRQASRLRICAYSPFYCKSSFTKKGYLDCHQRMTWRFKKVQNGSDNLWSISLSMASKHGDAIQWNLWLRKLPQPLTARS